MPGPPRDLLSDIRAGFQLRKVSERQLPPPVSKESTASRVWPCFMLNVNTQNVEVGGLYLVDTNYLLLL